VAGVPQAGQRRGTAHHHDAGDERGETAGLHGEHAWRHLDPVAENEYPEQDAGDWLAGADRRKRNLQRSGVERGLHQPDTDCTGADQRIR
jgi:hypothetical protein